MSDKNIEIQIIHTKAMEKDNSFSIRVLIDKNANIQQNDFASIDPHFGKPIDKVEPKFKVGDTMRTLQEANDGYTDGMPVVVSIDNEYYHCTNELIAIKDQDDYEFPPINVKQKPAVEPKFHEGDWVVYNHDICQIVKREEGCNKLVTVFGIEKELVNERNLSTARLWSIADAKDGDVLVIQKTDVTYESIFIFNKIENNRIIQYLHYFTTDVGEEVCEARSIDGFLGFVGTTVHPATKEQRDLLFKKIHEAGYEWDAEKKELKKIEQKSDWSEEDSPYYDDICEILINILHSETTDVNKDAVQKDLDWLKSLKERVKEN